MSSLLFITIFWHFFRMLLASSEKIGTVDWLGAKDWLVWKMGSLKI